MMTNKKTQILYIDFNKSKLETFKQIMENLGKYTIQISDSYHKAPDQLKTQVFAFIVIDFIDDQNFVDFLVNLRKSKNNVPIVVFTFEDQKNVIDKIGSLKIIYVKKEFPPQRSYKNLINVIEKSAEFN
jgi:DNA-binding NtrC family response regulator